MDICTYKNLEMELHCQVAYGFHWCIDISTFCKALRRTSEAMATTALLCNLAPLAHTITNPFPLHPYTKYLLVIKHGSGNPWKSPRNGGFQLKLT